MMMRSAAAEEDDIKSALVPIANGSEEMEATIIIDVLRRAGVNVTVASCEDDLVCEMSRKVCIRADCLIQEVVVDDGEKNNSKSSFDAIVVPGGMPGAERLAENASLDALLKRQERREETDRGDVRGAGGGVAREKFTRRGERGDGGIRRLI